MRGVTRHAKILDRLLSRFADRNLRFDELCALLHALGFAERRRGSHHIFTRDGIPEILNLQPRGGQAKPYQVRQARDVILKYKLTESFDRVRDDVENDDDA